MNAASHPVVLAALAHIEKAFLTPTNPSDDADDWWPEEDVPPKFDFDKPPPGFLVPVVGGAFVEGVLALAWAQFFLDTTPPGFEVFALSTGWEWAYAGEPVGAEVPYSLSKAEARHAAWLDFLGGAR